MSRKPSQSGPPISTQGPELPAPSHVLPETAVAKVEVEAVLDAIWQAAEKLPSKKQDRLKPDMVRLAGKSGDVALAKQWAQRLKTTEPEPEQRYVDYAAKEARAAIDAYGWDGFTQRASTRDEPFNVGRPEKMAAGVRLAGSPEQARDLMGLMFDLAKPNVSRGGGGDTFEQSDFGHVLAELSMQRCDLEAFDRATALTVAPESLRYAIWRARITGGNNDLLKRIVDEANEEDTSHVRQAMEAYGAVLSRGYCAE